MTTQDTTPTPIDWKRWTAWKVPAMRFEQRREPLLRHVRYSERFDDKLGGIAMITTDLPKYAPRSKPGDLMTSTRRRLWDALDWMSLQYSAGAPVAQLAEVWPHALAWAEEYGAFHEAYHRSPEADIVVPHASLSSPSYWIVALRLVAFGLLTGHAARMPRVMAFLDYANADLGLRDGLLERLVAPFVTGRGAPPDKATRHLPYRKLFKVFDAEPAKRPALMTKYLDEWYHASRREPYVDRHGEGDVSFYGYWSWEAAAVTWALGIDDATYRDRPFYPRDLVDFARAIPAEAPAPAAPPPQYAIQACPQTGWWSSPARHDSRRHFTQGEVFPTIPSETARGLTLWLWDPDQDGAPGEDKS